VGVTDEQITRLAGLDTCAVSDALDALGLSGVALGLHALTGTTRIAGRVLTVDLRRSDAVPTTRASRHLGTAAVEAAAPGEIIVVSAGGRTDAAGWGGVLALAAVSRGVAGVVIDGACRDVDEARDLGLPVYARAGVPRTARGRLREVAWNEPVEMAGVTVRPGDAVIADGSGVVFVPAGHIAAVLARAEEIAAKEAAMAARVRAGEPISRVMSGDYENMLRTEGTDHG
jgi:4-hydroxy-4-methyl-2-oxoglutarate aldolase